MAESDRNATVVALGGWQLVGTTIAGRYKVEGLLKEAETGSVFLVQHLQMRRRLALRLIATNNPKNADAVARFEREATGLPPIEHPNIAAASDFGRTESGEFFAAIEYLESAPRLRDAFDGRRFDAARVLHIARQLASVLEYLHDAGIIYQELRPENIWLTARKGDSDFVKVLDPSVAKLASGPVPLSPEQATGEKASARSDLYALGLLLYEMLTGKPPLEPAGAARQLKQLVSGTITPMRTAAPELAVPAALEAVVTRLLARTPAERFQTAAELRAALDAAAASPSQAPQPSPAPVIAVSSAPAQTTPAAPAPASAPPPSQPAASAPSAPEPAAPREEQEKSKSGKLEALRARLPQAGEAIAPYRANLPPILRKVPLWLLGMIVVLGLTLPLVVRSIVLSATSKETTNSSAPSAATPAAAPAVTSQASDAQLQAARAQGAQAVASLLEKFPHDGRVHRALVTALAAQNSGVAAMQALAKLVTLDPGAAEDPAMQQAVATALGTQASREAAVQIVESQMGALGADILYDLANKAGQNRAKALLYKQLVSRPGVRQHASHDTALAIELQLADGCDAKSGLLERAGQEGGTRVLGYLKYLTKPQQGCGPLGMLDCWMCMRQDNDLADAISAIEARTQGHQ